MYKTFVAVTLIFAGTISEANDNFPIVATSPDRNVGIEFSLQNASDGESIPHYRVTFRGKEVIEKSRLGIRLENSITLGGTCVIQGTESRSIHEEYTQVTGKRRNVVSDTSEIVIQLKEVTAPNRKWEVILRASNDGAAFRYRFPESLEKKAFEVVGELTEFRLHPNSQSFALPLNGYTSSYEQRYAKKAVQDIPNDWLIGLPLLFESPDGAWVAITEADVNEYAGTYLSHAGLGLLNSRLSPDPKNPGIAVRAALPHSSPWRVFMIGDRVGQLAESDIVLNLSSPCLIKDTSWIKSGKTTFPWWNGFYENNVSFKPGLNTATAKYYIDFCSEAGIPYHSLDGIDNVAWYNGPIVPYEGAVPDKGIEGLDLPEVLKYAKEKGIRIRLWMHWKAAESHMYKTFPLYQEWGIEGVMLDFMDRDDQEMNRFVRDAVRLAADNHLTVTLHGCPKPTGLERTYPNLLTHEGVMNLEYDKWDPVGITPDHELTIPFTRMLAGPLDFHQGSFRTVQKAAFEPREKAPIVIGSPARTLASYVIYQNHLSMVADYPSAYRNHPGLAVLAAIPTTWDETKVLDARIGEFAIFARQNGREWHIGAMTDERERTLEIPLNFLPTGSFVAKIVTDDDGVNPKLNLRNESVTDKTSLKIKLVSQGGAYVQLTPTGRSQ